MGFLIILEGYLKKKIYIPEHQLYSKVRPYSEKYRKRIFSALDEQIANSIVLDLFAGSGICSFESISRGAKSAQLVDSNKQAVLNLHNNKYKLKLENKIFISCKNIEVFILDAYYSNSKYDIVFLDPPYNLILTNFFWSLLLNITNDVFIIVYRSNVKFKLGFTEQELSVQSIANVYILSFNKFNFSEKWDLNPRL